MGTLVSHRLEDSVATITMDDGKVNALSPQLLAELNTALDRAAADRAVVVLAGRPGVFSAGFDLAVLKAGGRPASEMIRAGFELAARVLSFPSPVLIACTGHAMAMGAFLLMSGDYRIGVDGPGELQNVVASTAARLASLDLDAHGVTKLRAREPALTAIRAAIDSDQAALRA